MSRSDSGVTITDRRVPSREPIGNVRVTAWKLE